MAGYAEIARLIADRVRRPNPVVGATIVEDLGLGNDTPAVAVYAGGTTRKAIYLPPHAPQEGYPVFVTRLGPGAGAPLAVVASNFQVGPQGDRVWGGAIGAGGGPPRGPFADPTWGGGYGTWGA